MHTEQEARKKWCPQVRVSDGEHYAAENRFCQAGKVSSPEKSGVMLPEDNEGFNWDRCIASECMMWRWTTVFTHGNTYSQHEQGFCGLAGKP